MEKYSGNTKASWTPAVAILPAGQQGVALGEGKIYMTQFDAWLVAIDHQVSDSASVQQE
jgi:hypothetical protein